MNNDTIYEITTNFVKNVLTKHNVHFWLPLSYYISWGDYSFDAKYQIFRGIRAIKFDLKDPNFFSQVEKCIIGTFPTKQYE